MPRDWPDPRFPDKPDSGFALALMALTVISVHIALACGVIETLRSAIG